MSTGHNVNDPHADLAAVFGAWSKPILETLDGDARKIDAAITALQAARAMATRKAESDWKLSQSFWPTLDVKAMRELGVRWIVRAVRSKQALELRYDFVQDAFTLLIAGTDIQVGDDNARVSTIYSLIPSSEIALLTKMRARAAAGPGKESDGGGVIQHFA